jgi:hypothetical protein
VPVRGNENGPVARAVTKEMSVVVAVESPRSRNPVSSDSTGPACPEEGIREDGGHAPESSSYEAF